MEPKAMLRRKYLSAIVTILAALLFPILAVAGQQQQGSPDQGVVKNP